MDKRLLDEARRVTKLTEWKVQIDPEQGGISQIDGLTATGGDVAIVFAEVRDSGISQGGDPVICSNPAWVCREPAYRLYWGDFHVHTVFSNCSDWACKDPEFCYQYAKEVTHLDFAAPADPLRGIAWEEGRWPHLQAMAKKYNQPGEFVSFLGFESSHAKGFGGDNNVYYLADNMPCFWPNRGLFDGRGNGDSVVGSVIRQACCRGRLFGIWSSWGECFVDLQW